MSKAPRPPADLEAADYFRELTEPHHHAEKYGVRERGEWQWRTHHTRVPALIDQLWASDVPSLGAGANGGGARPGYASKPAARLEALDAVGRIHREATEWLAKLGATPSHHDTGGLLRQLHGLLPAVTDKRVRRRVEGAVRSWWAQARVVTGWDTPAWNPDVTCPNCEMRGALKIRVAEQLAVCGGDEGCGAVWDELTIAFLADHIRAQVDAERVRTSLRACACPLPMPEVDDLAVLCPRCGSSRCTNALMGRLRALLVG